jgi:hypothetical protein
MDPITLIVTALSAGAASALQDDAKGAVKAAFERLRHLVKRRFKDPANGEYLMEKHAAAPEVWQEPLKAELVEAQAADDPDVIAAAQELMKILDAHGTAVGKYHVNAQHAQDVQIGDHNFQVSSSTQVNYYGSGQNANAGREGFAVGRDLFLR